MPSAQDKKSPANWRAVASPAGFDQVHTSLLDHFPELVGELGGDSNALLERLDSGLDAHNISRFQPTYPQLATLLEVASRELDCPDFGMRLAQHQARARKTSPIGRVMQTAASYGDALHFIITHSYAHSLAARIWMHPLDEHLCFVGHDSLVDSIANRVQAVEQMLLLGHLGALELTGGKARARRVHFRHHPVADLRCYQRHFGCEIRFGENADGIVFSRQDLAQPITHPNRKAHESMVSRIEKRFTRRRPPTHAEVRGAIMRLLGTGFCDNQRVASDLRMNLRTLHRRLRAEGTSFQHVKDEVRQDMLLYYLQQTDLRFSRISEQLGFSEQAVLTRKCRHWFAATPTEIRERAKLEN